MRIDEWKSALETTLFFSIEDISSSARCVLQATEVHPLFFLRNWHISRTYDCNKFESRKKTF